MSFILQNVGIAWKGPNYVSLPVGILPHGTIFNIGHNAYHWDDLIVVLLTVPVLLVLCGSSSTRSRARRCAPRPRTGRPPR